MQENVLISTRIPVNLKGSLSKYCVSHGLKISYFITETIKEKLLEISEDNKDIDVANERLKNIEFISQKKFNKSLDKDPVLRKLWNNKKDADYDSL